MATDPFKAQVAGALRMLQTQIKSIQQQHAIIIAAMNNRPRSITEEIDAISGRRLDYVFADESTFTTADEGQVAQALTFTVSQDGPFIMTHYPMALWRPSAPDDATNIGRWRPVSSFPLPDQVYDTDIIDLMYQMKDGGTGRLLQSASRGPIFSRPDNMVPLPVPTLFAPNAVIEFLPVFNQITFNGDPTPPTEGILHVDLIGYRIVNL